MYVCSILCDMLIHSKQHKGKLKGEIEREKEKSLHYYKINSFQLCQLKKSIKKLLYIRIQKRLTLINLSPKRQTNKNRISIYIIEHDNKH